mgnify:CR=1 FL=1
MSEQIPLEPSTRLSESVVWDIQRRYFEHAGQDAWSKGVVPHYVTTNAYVAKSYARVIAAYVEDLKAMTGEGGGLPEGPIHVVEMGAGSGRLGFLLSHELALLSRDRELPPFRVVLTDFTDTNVDAWLAHPDLADAFAEGRLDCARFDADDPAPLALRHSGETLDQVDGPVIVVANYVVDTLRQDAFAVRDGRLHEVLVRASMPTDAERTAEDPEASRDVDLSKTQRPTRLPYYDDAVLDGILQDYVGALDDAEILLPTGMIGALRYLRGRCDGRMLVVMGDKGYRAPRDMEGRTLGSLVKHGSFSVMANLDAVGRSLGGVMLTHGNRYTRFTIAAATTQTAPFRRLRGAYRDHIDSFGPAEYHRGFKLVRQAEGETPLAQILLLLRVSGYDPVVFARYGEQVLEACGEANAAMQQDLALCLAQVLDRTYALSPKDDVRFVAGRVFFRMERIVEAAQQFTKVTEVTPDRRTAWFNLGLCHERMGDPAEAKRCYQSALKADPEYGRAQAALERVKGA